MLKYTKQIPVYTAQDVYKKYNISKQERAYFIEMARSGEVERAVDEFIARFLIEPTEEYSLLMEEFLLIMEQGEVERKELRKSEREISLLSFGLSSLLKVSFGVLIADLIGPSIFSKMKIRNPAVKDAILKSTLRQFESLTAKAMTNSQTDILNNIRAMQREMILFNVMRGKRLTGEQLTKETQRFLLSVERKLPVYGLLKEGKFLASRSYGLGEIVKHYKLNNYIEMATRTTLLNIDRTASQIFVTLREDAIARKKGRVPVRVMRYALIDNRPLRTGVEREICKKILKTIPYGVPLLALDEETAILLGIMSVDEVMSTPDYAMGPYCRHGLVPISVALRGKLEQILKKKLKENS